MWNVSLSKPKENVRGILKNVKYVHARVYTNMEPQPN